MRWITGTVRDVVRRRVLQRAGGIDLSKVDRIPDRLAWPLRRVGFDPDGRLGELRDQEPVARLTTFLGIRVWLVTGAEEARRVLADSTTFSTDIRPYVGRSGDGDSGDIGGLGFTDPPDHTRLRKLLTPEFTLRRLERLRPAIADVVDRQLDALADAGDAADLFRDFAFPVPFLVICDLLGLPVEDRDRFRALASARFDVSGGGAGALGAISGSREYLLDFTRRQRADPGDGLVGRIVRDHGDEINDFDLAGLADGVLTGGLETSASMLASGVAVLLAHPEHYRRLAEEPAEVDRTVEELLRYLSVVQIAFPRFARVDLELGGHRVRAGDVVICHLSGAARDPRVGGDDRFDPDRARPAPHLAFGHGLHRCIGAELARMELRIAYPALARRFPDLDLGTEAPAFRRSSIVYGVDALPVRLNAEALSGMP